MAGIKSVARRIYYMLSPGLRFRVRHLYYFPVDLYDSLLGRRDKFTPPKGKIFVGAGEFKKAGEDLLGQIIKTCDLKPESRVLDVGCGIGRLAVPLTRFLNDKGSYEGFDVVKQGIDWCVGNIASVYPNFRFRHVNLKNNLYNLSTQNQACNYTFPYNDNEFDLVIITSVFTHMLPADLENYIGQVRRVLKTGGRCFATFFLLDPTKGGTSDNNPPAMAFPYSYGYYSLMDRRVKEANVAYQKTWLFDHLFLSNRLSIKACYPGWWSGRPPNGCLGFQDTIVLTKEAGML